MTDEFPLLAPDGSKFAYTEGRATNGNSVATDLFVVVTDGGAPRRLTSFPDGTGARTVAWSPAGGTIAVVSETRPAPWIRPPVQPSVDLWLIGDDGQVRRIPLALAGAVPPRQSGEYWLLWSPDGTRLIVGTDIMHMEGEPSPHVDPLLVVPETGGVAALADARNVTWSPDGAMIAAIGGVAAGAPTLDVMDRDGGGRRSLGPVTPGDWTRIVWAP